MQGVRQGNEFPSREELTRATGRGVRALVLDSGVEASHPDLQGIAIRSFEVLALGDLGLAIRPGPGGDPTGHGTAVAGILRRWAPAAEIDVLRVFGRDGSPVDSTRILAGLVWGVEQGYHVINCSLGSESAEYLPEYKRAVDEAFCRNAWIVAAAHNLDPDRPHYPAEFPTVLAADAGALEPLQLARRAGRVVELVTCGIDVDVAWRGGGRRVESGSSYAAAHLAALAARLRELRPDWNACEAKAALYRWV